MKIETYKDVRGDWRWRAIGRNGLLVAGGGGDGYRRRGDMLRVMRKIIRPELMEGVK